MKAQKHLAEFGGMTHYEAFKAASAFLKKNPYTALEIPPKRYVLSGDKSKKLQSSIMTSGSCSDITFNRGISLISAKSCEIKGNGAEIITDGFMQALYIRDCEDIVISDLKFSSARPAYSVGKVVSCKGDGKMSILKVDFGMNFPLNINSPITSASISLNDKICEIDISSVKITSNFSAELCLPDFEDYLGSKVCIVHTDNLLDTIRIYNCKNIRFDNITVTLGSGLTLSAENCDDLDISGIIFEPPIGRHRYLTQDDIKLNNCNIRGN